MKLMNTGTTQNMKPTDPLTVEEVTKASETFFPLFEVVMSKMPDGSSVEDTLRIMESVCGLAHNLRATEDEDKTGSFGFNKKVEEDA